MTAKDANTQREEIAAHRPISPHFNIYKWPIAGLASGAQRVTGFALVLGWTTAGLLSMPGLPVTVLPVFIEAIKTVPVLHGLIKGGIAFSFGFHGTKNAFMPRMKRLDLNGVHRAAMFAIIGGFTCTGAAVFLI